MCQFFKNAICEHGQPNDPRLVQYLRWEPSKPDEQIDPLDLCAHDLLLRSWPAVQCSGTNYPFVLWPPFVGNLGDRSSRDLLFAVIPSDHGRHDALELGLPVADPNSGCDFPLSGLGRLRAVVRSGLDRTILRSQDRRQETQLSGRSEVPDDRACLVDGVLVSPGRDLLLIDREEVRRGVLATAIRAENAAQVTQDGLGFK